MMSGILTAAIFLLYALLWATKRRSLRNRGIEANAGQTAVSHVQQYFWKLQRLLTISMVVLIIWRIYAPGIPSSYALGGFFVALSGLFLCWIAQWQMGDSWRVGIPENQKTPLVTTGLYRLVRNPTYTGLYLVCLGLILLNPITAFAIWIAVFVIMVQFQVRHEEDYLYSVHGSDYATYFSRTKRYIPYVY